MGQPFQFDSTDLASAQKLRDMGQLDDNQFQRMQAKVAPPLAPEAPSAFDGIGGDFVARQSPQPLPERAPLPPSDVKPEGSWAGPEDAEADAVKLASDQQASAAQGQREQQFQQLQTAIMAPFVMQQAAVAEGQRAGAAQGAETAAKLQTISDANKKMMATNQAAEDERQRKLDDQMSTVQAKANDVSNFKLDSNRLYRNMSTGDKVMAGIGMVLGSLGPGGSKGSDAIERAIKDDIALQSAEYEMKGNAYKTQRGVYGDMFDTFKDKRVAEDATRLAYLNNAQIEVQRIGAKFSGAESKAKAMALYADIEMKKQQTLLGLQQQFKTLNPTATGANTNPESLTEEQRNRFVPGYGLAVNKHAAETFSAYVPDYKSATFGIGKLLAVADMPGASVTPEIRASAQVFAKMAQGALRISIVGGGAMSDKEQEILQSIVADPSTIFSLNSQNVASLNSVVMKLNNDHKERAKIAGLRTPATAVGFNAIGD